MYSPHYCSRALPTGQSSHCAPPASPAHTALPKPKLPASGFSNHVNNHINSPLRELAKALLALCAAKVEEDAFLRARDVLVVYMISQACGPMKQAGGAAAALLTILEACKTAARMTMQCWINSVQCQEKFQQLADAHGTSTDTFVKVKALVTDAKESLEQQSKHRDNNASQAAADLKARERAHKYAELVAELGFSLATGAVAATGIMAPLFWPVSIPAAVVAVLSGLAGVAGKYIAHKLDAKVVVARDELAESQEKEAAAKTALRTFLSVVPNVNTCMGSLHNYVAELLDTIQSDLITCQQHANASQGIYTSQMQDCVDSLCSSLDKAMESVKDLVDICKGWEDLANKLAAERVKAGLATHGTNPAHQVNSAPITSPKPAQYPSVPGGSTSGGQGSPFTGPGMPPPCHHPHTEPRGQAQYVPYNAPAYPAHTAYGVPVASPYPSPTHPPPLSPIPASTATSMPYGAVGLPTVHSLDGSFGPNPCYPVAEPLHYAPTSQQGYVPPAYTGPPSACWVWP